MDGTGATRVADEASSCESEQDRHFVSIGRKPNSYILPIRLLSGNRVLQVESSPCLRRKGGGARDIDSRKRCRRFLAIQCRNFRALLRRVDPSVHCEADLLRPLCLATGCACGRGTTAILGDTTLSQLLSQIPAEDGVHAAIVVCFYLHFVMEQWRASGVLLKDR